MKKCILPLTMLAVFVCGAAYGQDAQEQRPVRQDMRARWQKAMAEYKAKDPKGYAELMKLRETDRDAFRAKVMKIMRERGGRGSRPANTGRQAAFKVPDGVKVARDIVYATYGSRKVMLDMYLPKQPPAGKLPCIMVIHGGGWRSGNKSRFARFATAFAEKGFAAACVGYRLRPQVDIPQCVEDVKAATRWVRANAGKYNIDAGRLGAYGGSAGAHLAAMLGTSFKAKDIEGKGGNQGVSSRVHAVVAMATPSDFTKFGRALRGDKDAAGRISPAAYVDADSARFLLMHARGDRVVPYNQSTILLDKLKAAKVPASLTTIEGKSHAFWNGRGPDSVKALGEAIKFFTQTLKGPAAKAAGK